MTGSSATGRRRWCRSNSTAIPTARSIPRRRGGPVPMRGAGALDADALLESRSDLRRLDVLIERLPPPLREAIVLRELQELDYRQIAEVTGVPIGTVMSRLHRARAALRRAWDGKDVGNGMR